MKNLNEFSSVSFFRTDKVCRDGGLGRSTHHERIQNGLFVPPVKNGERIALYPSNEVYALFSAQIAGVSDTKMRGLVQYLIESRNSDPVAVFLASDKQPEELENIIQQLQAHLETLVEAIENE